MPNDMPQPGVIADYVKNLVQIGKISPEAVVIFNIVDNDETVVQHGNIEAFISKHYERVLSDLGTFQVLRSDREVSLDERFVMPLIQREEEAASLHDVLDSQAAFLSGAGGSGKSMLLSRIALDCAKGESDLFPIYVRLADLHIKGHGLWQEIVDKSEVQNFFTKSVLQQMFAQSKVLLLLDGLDELFDKQEKKKMLLELERLLSKYPKLSYVLTSRPEPINKLPKGIAKFELMPFDLERVETFARQWFAGHPKVSAEDFLSVWKLSVFNVHHDLSDDANSVSNELLEKSFAHGNMPLNNEFFNQRLRENIATVPLILTFLCTLYEQTEELPHADTLMYEGVLNLYLKDWNSERLMDDEVNLSDRQLMKFLNAFAAHIDGQYVVFTSDIFEDFAEEHFKRFRVFNFQKLLDLLHTDFGFFSSSDHQHYRFFHSSIQEFLAAKARLPGESTDVIEQLVQGNLKKDFFHYFRLLPDKEKEALLSKGLLNASQFLTFHHSLIEMMEECRVKANDWVRTDNERGLCFFFYMASLLTTEVFDGTYDLSLRITEMLADRHLNASLSADPDYAFFSQMFRLNTIGKKLEHPQLEETGLNIKKKFPQGKLLLADRTEVHNYEAHKALYGFLSVVDKLVHACKGEESVSLESSLSVFIDSGIQEPASKYSGHFPVKPYEYIMYARQQKDFKQTYAFVFKALDIIDQSPDDYIAAYSVFAEREKYGEQIEVYNHWIKYIRNHAEYPDGRSPFKDLNAKTLEDAYWELFLNRAWRRIEWAVGTENDNGVRLLEQSYNEYKSIPEDIFAPSISYLAFCTMKLGRYEEAIRYYRQSVRQDPDYEIGYVNLVYLYLEVHELAKAELEFLRLKKRDNAEVRPYIGDLEKRLKQVRSRK